MNTPDHIVSDHIVSDAARRIFRDLGDPQTVRGHQTTKQKDPLWVALEEAGLTRAWLDTNLNGAGASLVDGFDIVKIAGEFAVAVPLVETLLASWLLGQANLSAPEGALSCAPTSSRDTLRLNANGTISGSANAVALARNVQHLVVAIPEEKQVSVALLAREQCELIEGLSIAGEPRARIVLQDVKPLSIGQTGPAWQIDHVIQMGAAVRAMQMSGALQSILDRSVSYANERIAFEKPIGRFQAIQHSLARLSAEVAAAIASAGSAADAIANETSFNDAVFLEVASAKIRVGEAVTTAAAIAHQVHGAIGFSQEHVLHRYTQRLWSWRDDFDTESIWARRLGEFVARQGADALWPLLSAR